MRNAAFAHVAAEYQNKPGGTESYRVARGNYKYPPGFKLLKNLTRAELVDVASVLLKGDMEGVRKAMNDPRSPPLIAALASVMVKIHERGDMHALDLLLNRIIGKVRDETHFSGAIGGTQGSTVIVNLPSNGREAKKPETAAAPPGTALPAPAVPESTDDDFDFGWDDDDVIDVEHKPS